MGLADRLFGRSEADTGTPIVSRDEATTTTQRFDVTATREVQEINGLEYTVHYEILAGADPAEYGQELVATRVLKRAGEESIATEISFEQLPVESVDAAIQQTAPLPADFLDSLSDETHPILTTFARASYPDLVHTSARVEARWSFPSGNPGSEYRIYTGTLAKVHYGQDPVAVLRMSDFGSNHSAPVEFADLPAEVLEQARRVGAALPAELRLTKPDVALSDLDDVSELSTDATEPGIQQPGLGGL